MTELRSHYQPNLKLREHLAQVRAAAEAILQRHFPWLPADYCHLTDWIFEAVQMHDAGKGTSAFQGYIANPSAWRGNKFSKAHTPLSFVCTLEYGREQAWDWRKRLAVAALAAGHHSRFKTTDELEQIVVNPDTANAIEQQLAELDWAALDQALAVTLPRIDPADDPCGVLLDEMTDVLFARHGPLHSQSLIEAVRYRLLCQYAFSVLLEADKAYLAVKPEHLPTYVDPLSNSISPQVVTTFLRSKDTTPLDDLRQDARRQLEAQLGPTSDGRILTLTLPTGSGKTLLAATWALSLRERLRHDGQAPKIIVVLPYLSVIDQTQTEWRDLLEPLGKAVSITSYHSLSERVFPAAPDLDDNASEFFLDTWQADVILTTFDQLLFALFDRRTRYQMRFHNLCDALIVMDEVQVLPCQLWHPMAHAFGELVRLGSTRVLAMSATQPGFLAAAKSNELMPDSAALFARLNRYRLVLKHQPPPQPLAEFGEEVTVRAADWENRRVLLVLNTRRSARMVRDALAEAGHEVLFLSADVTPKDRLKRIENIKQKVKHGEPCLVVSTQCIEAGVDIDMDFAIRDFAPLDCLIQVAGRCNRHNKRGRCDVEIVSLADKSGGPFAGRIYDPILLQATRAVLGNRTEVPEEHILPLIDAYFKELADKKDQGQRHTESWAYWQEMEEPVRILFRGEQAEQITFVVIEQDPDLVTELARVAAIRDRWDKRREHRMLAARLAKITISTYVRHRGRAEIEPADYATLDATGSHWLLQTGLYDPERGLDLGLTDEQSQAVFLV